MQRTLNKRNCFASIAALLMASPALAHGQGMGIVIIFPPIAAVMFAIAAAIARCVFQRTRGKVYAVVTVLCLLLWIPCFVLSSLALLDSHVLGNMTEMGIGSFMAFQPIGIAILLRFWHRRKRAAD